LSVKISGEAERALRANMAVSVSSAVSDSVTINADVSKDGSDDVLSKLKTLEGGDMPNPIPKGENGFTFVSGLDLGGGKGFTPGDLLTVSGLDL